MYCTRTVLKLEKSGFFWKKEEKIILRKEEVWLSYIGVLKLEESGFFLKEKRIILKRKRFDLGVLVYNRCIEIGKKWILLKKKKSF